MRTNKKLSCKYVNTAKIIKKVTMTLLINSNKDFDFVDGVIKTPCLLLSILFLQYKVSLCERNTHDVSILLASRRMPEHR